MPSQAVQDRQWLAKEVQMVLDLARAVIPLWQREDHLLREPGLQAPRRQVAAKPDGTKHLWTWCSSHWQCLTCHTECFRQRKNTTCPGRSAHIGRLLEHPMRHKLRAGELESGAMFLWCTACGAWGARTTTRLLSRVCCGEPSRKHKDTLARIKRGLHPWHGSRERIMDTFGLGV